MSESTENSKKTTLEKEAPAPAPESRNEVFQAPTMSSQMPSSPGRQSQSIEYEVPVESIPLPSRGIVYPAGTALAGVEMVEIKSMTAVEEDILTSEALVKKGTVISEFLRSILINKSIDVESMLSGDRNALMVAGRITGYGHEYEAKVACPDCGVNSDNVFSLATLSIKRLAIEPSSPGENIFAFTLPVSKKKVQFRFLTGRDERDIMVIQERMRKAGQQTDNLVTTRLQYALVSVDGMTDRSLINKFVLNMPARDSLTLRKFMDNNEPGIDMKSMMYCNSCNEENEVALPIGTTFFWPEG